MIVLYSETWTIWLFD
ncbi:hypothetical protein RDI58_020982 [Solanum bulbocastanum]|uniref:Uncharacterized protein n=1 Tax=Solanum bulbocastanum TaxID=147425 RepID=A0AAN8T7T3_SOLBU